MTNAVATNANPPREYDFLFVGLGAANCLLLLQLQEKNLLDGKTCAVIEPHAKDRNDRTFCFWCTPEELQRLHLDTLVSSRWEFLKVSGREKQATAPLTYYRIRAIDLYQKAKSVLQRHNIPVYRETCTNPPQKTGNLFAIGLEQQVLHAETVFDSRPPKFSPPEKNQSHLFQSFLGWEIQTAQDVFDPSTAVLMDFDIPQNGHCQFMYVLPFSETTALVEITRFGKEKISPEEAQPILAQYVAALGAAQYAITDTEQGVIPMSSAPIGCDELGEKWIPTGARANMVKPSTGYAFHSMAEDALAQAAAVSGEKTAGRKKTKPRFAFYDRLLLKILETSPDSGKLIFESLFKKVPVTNILFFLREKSSVSQDLYIFSKLPVFIFLKTAVKDLWHRFSEIPPAITSLVFCILACILFSLNLNAVTWVLLGLGFFTVGLSHGALDHLTHRPTFSRQQLAVFIVKYLGKGLLLGLVWLVFPDVALAAFLGYSAWHFGQADFKEWRLKQDWNSFVWGAAALLLILFFHLDETVGVLVQIRGLQLPEILKRLSPAGILQIQIAIVLTALATALRSRSRLMLFTLLNLFIATQLPLLIAFAVYFVFQHSMHGWRHLIKGLNTTGYRLWLRSLPFTAAAAAIIAAGLIFTNGNYWGIFFILLSCISVPHIVSMHRFYAKLRAAFDP